jgi:hypothetical protein
MIVESRREQGQRLSGVRDADHWDAHRLGEGFVHDHHRCPPLYSLRNIPVSVILEPLDANEEESWLDPPGIVAEALDQDTAAPRGIEGCQALHELSKALS